MADLNFEVAVTAALNKLESEIRKSRKNKFFILEFRKIPLGMPGEPEKFAPVLDAFTSEHGFRDIGESWIEVGRDTAARVLIHALSKGLAYGTILMDGDKAASLAEKYFALFEEGLRFFTNGDCVVGSVNTVDGKTVPGFSAITKATLDTGIVAADSKHIGMLWMWDDD
jgi:hypothetical protein